MQGVGIFDTLRLASSLELDAPELPATLTASDTNYPGSFDYWYAYDATITRQQAMTVPAVARARNILCATAGSLEFYRYNDMTDAKISNTPLLYAPDPNSPASVTWTWVYDSLLFYGKAYLEVLEIYAEDGRPARARWVDPARVTQVPNQYNTLIIGYMVDGMERPASGVGSLITFTGVDEGLLARGGSTLRTAIALEQASKRAAEEPVPQTVLKSNGVDLPDNKIKELLTSWKQARQTRATAYLYSGLTMEAVGFDPRSQQLVEARQYIAAEIARLCNIPAWYLGAETNSMTYSNVESERRNLLDLSMLPYLLKPVEDRLSMNDITPRGIEVKADLREFLRGTALERITVIEKMLGTGLISIDEARAMEDLAPRGTA